MKSFRDGMYELVPNTIRTCWGPMGLVMEMLVMGLLPLTVSAALLAILLGLVVATLLTVLLLLGIFALLILLLPLRGIALLRRNLTLLPICLLLLPLLLHLRLLHLLLGRGRGLLADGVDTLGDVAERSAPHGGIGIRKRPVALGEVGGIQVAESGTDGKPDYRADESADEICPAEDIRSTKGDKDATDYGNYGKTEADRTELLSRALCKQCQALADYEVAHRRGPIEDDVDNRADN